jgi:hypothetical protein
MYDVSIVNMDNKSRRSFLLISSRLGTVKHDFKSHRLQNQQDSFVMYPYYYFKTICVYVILLYYAVGIFSVFNFFLLKN